MYDAENAKPVLHDSLEGWGGEEGRKGFQEKRDAHVRMADSC